jgi:mitochondrial fission protein ELM1
VPSEPAGQASPRIWALLGAHKGDNNQVLALAAALGMPFETKVLRYNRLRQLSTWLLGSSIRSLKPDCRASVAGEPPDLIISIGHRSVPIVRNVRARSGGRTLSVHLGNPRISPRHFDLVITTPQYPVPDAANVLRLPIAIGSVPAADRPSSATEAFLADFPAPRRLFLIGGPSRYWRIRSDDIVAAIRELLSDVDRTGGSLILLGSPRTPRDVLDAAAKASVTLVPTEGPPSYAELLEAADSIFVTADSVSMVSEALRTGKPLGLVPVQRTWFGALWMGIMDRLRPGRPVHPRDLRFFWRELERRGMAGTVTDPRSGTPPDVLSAAAEKVRQLLG